jgi:hypothetical protein
MTVLEFAPPRKREKPPPFGRDAAGDLARSALVAAALPASRTVDATADERPVSPLDKTRTLECGPRTWARTLAARGLSGLFAPRTINALRPP